MMKTDHLLLTVLLHISMIGLCQQSLHISSDAELTGLNDSFITLQGLDVVDNRGVVHVDQLALTSADTHITTTNTFDVNELLFQTNHQYEMEGSFSVNELLQLESKADVKLLTNSAIHLGDNAEIKGENDEQLITGDEDAKITIGRIAGTSDSFGNIGVDVLQAAQNLGKTQVTRHYTNTAEINGNTIAHRYYDIKAEYNENLDATVQFHYATVDLNGLEAGDLSLFRSSDGNNWQEMGGTVHETNRFVELANVQSFSTWVFSQSGQVLPVELVDFTATAQPNKTVQCLWSTASETNNSHFDIQRSKDGHSFETVGTVQGAGHSNRMNYYEFIDEHPYMGTSYYRLKQVDFDGNENFSSIEQVRIHSVNDLTVYPNPVIDQLHVKVPSNLAFTSYRIVTIGGQIVQEANQQNDFVVGFSGFTSGTYLLQLLNHQTVIYQTKIIKQ